MNDRTRTIYEFSGFRLDPARRVLSSADGDPIPLKPKVLDTLLYFVERPFELVTKDALMKGIWPDTVVEENNLNQNISVLRRVLGERPGEHRFIVTEPRRGYRFVAAVEEIDVKTDAVPNQHVPADPAPAVSGPRAASWRPVARPALAGALVVGIVAAGLFVAGRAGNDPPAPVAGRVDAGALPTKSARAYEYYLSGLEYERRNSHLGTELPLAAQQYQRAVDEDPGFALAWSRLATAHIALYWTQIDPSDARLAMARAAVDRARERGADLPEAHLAMARLHVVADHDYDEALRAVENAVRGMPADPEPWIVRLDIERRLGHWEQALASADRAVELDPRDPARLFARAAVSVFLRDYARAQDSLDRTVDLLPDNAQARSHGATIPLYRDGDVTKLAALADDTLADHRTRAWAGWLSSLWAGRYEAAIGHLEAMPPGERLRALGTFDVSLPSAYARTYRLAGRQELAAEMFRTARAQAEQALAMGPGNPRTLTRLETELAEALAALDETEAAVTLARRALGRMIDRHDAMDSSIARVEILLRVLIPAGAFDLAIDELDAYLSGPGVWSVEGLARHPEIGPLRDDPRFAALVEKYQRR